MYKEWDFIKIMTESINLSNEYFKSIKWQIQSQPANLSLSPSFCVVWDYTHYYISNR